MKIDTLGSTSRRDFIKRSAAAGVGALAALYVRPAMRTVGVQGAYAQATFYTPEGCTPGFWKNHTPDDKKNFWSGTPYEPTDDFDTVFGRDVFNPNRTLLVALTTGGGGWDALGRHAVAALLNATHPDTNNFIYSEGVVKQKVQYAYDNPTLVIDGKSIVEITKDEFVVANESSCMEDGVSSISLRADP